MKVQIKPHTLHFHQPAGTSRGVYTTRKVWYVSLHDSNIPEHIGTGECAPLPKLSCDDVEDYESLLGHFCHILETDNNKDGTTEKEAFISDELREQLRPYPSIMFGLETAVWHYNRRTTALSDTLFGKGERGIQINGLIWMGRYDEMNKRIEDKLNQGFSCIKLKIGAIGFDEEVELLHNIRNRFSKDVIQLRVDANGAFSPGDDALQKLNQLSKLDIHSIEQPIMAGQWQEMAHLCRNTPLPIALDEELIGTNDTLLKHELLDTIRPQYIILKPSLHGGICGSDEWISMAEQRHIGWWATSALESNIGLNAIAHWCATLQEQREKKTWIPQGLGTGQLFTDNIPMPLRIIGEQLWYQS